MLGFIIEIMFIILLSVVCFIIGFKWIFESWIIFVLFKDCGSFVRGIVIFIIVGFWDVVVKFCMYRSRDIVIVMMVFSLLVLCNEKL